MLFKSMEYLFSLILNYKGGVDECKSLLNTLEPLFGNIHDLGLHLEKLEEIESATDSEDGSKIVIESVDKDFNIQYPHLKEIAFREKFPFSYTIEMINQIWVEKGEQRTDQFMSNEYIDKESHKQSHKQGK